MTNGMRAIHPGEVLREEFGVTRDTRVGNMVPERLDAILSERHDISEVDLDDLARHTRTTYCFWRNLQATYERRREILDVVHAVLAERDAKERG